MTRESAASFREAWSSRVPFDTWVRNVGDSFADAELSLEAAASAAGVNPAELEAVLHLALMDAEDLALLATKVPPKTTWFLFASASHAGVQAGLEALRRDNKPTSAFGTVRRAMYEVEGPDEAERVAALPAEVFAHLAKKAKQYNRLRDNDRKALGDFARRKRSGQPLTIRQVAYATGLLTDLVEAGVVSPTSPDGDQDICNLVLAALNPR